MTWTVKPDIYLAELAASTQLAASGRLVAPVISFATNDLAIMVRAGNPSRVATLADLGRAGLALAMPIRNSKGLQGQIRASSVKAGGEALAELVYGKKVRDGETVLTRIHHRQTPLFLMQHLVEAGVTWRSEAIFHKQIGNSIAHVDIPAAVNTLAKRQRRHGSGRPPRASRPRMARFRRFRRRSQDSSALRLQALCRKAAIVTPLRISPTREEKRR
jgi:molybdate transport system substrate-binding protein